MAEKETAAQWWGLAQRVGQNARSQIRSRLVPSSNAVLYAESAAFLTLLGYGAYRLTRSDPEPNPVTPIPGEDWVFFPPSDEVTISPPIVVPPTPTVSGAKIAAVVGVIAVAGALSYYGSTRT